ncbi:MAG TPA: 3'(2'),5'-bisphosphate nucleotidase CysQ [Hyphomonadaceae bacterium]|nr:3'(2'),5'-bisphosphate nucleotidase CysQ [Hyphomonadaceae bacterium]
MTALLDDLIALALAAGREIMAVREAGFETLKKGDGSPVTIADQRAEALIEAGLAKLAPGVPMLGEESVEAGRIPELGARFFCVDPLDGTRGFAKGGSNFTVNIALIEDGAPTMGAIYAPARGELYAGEAGRALKAQCDEHGAPEAYEALSVAHAAPGAWRIVASDHSGRDESTKRFIATLKGVAAHASSSIKFCRLAEGEADLYPRFGDVCEWDAAAGHAILSAAGGGVMRLDGAPLRYGEGADDFLIHGFVAYASDAAKAAALMALG